MRRLSGKLTYANVMATVAVFIALGGASYAATQLPKNSVGAKQLKAKSVTTGKIANNAINGTKVANGSLTGEDINLNALGTVPSASKAAEAGNSNTVTGHAATCPDGTVLIRGVCFDGTSNPVAADLKTAADACAAKGGYLPTPIQLFTIRGEINLGTGVENDKQFSDVIYADDGGGTYWTITVDGTGALERQQISNPARYICAYPLVR